MTGSAKARRVLAALLRQGWSIKRQTGSHRVLQRVGWPDYVFAFHEGDEIGPVMMKRSAKHTGLDPTAVRSRERNEFRAFERIPPAGHHAAL